MQQRVLDRVARSMAAAATRRSLVGAIAAGALGAIGIGSAARVNGAQGTPAANDAAPPPLRFDPARRSGGDSESEIKRGALLGNFDQFCRIVPYRDVDGLAIMEDDIILGLSDEVEGSDCLLRSGQAAPIDGAQYRWPYGLVPYAFHESLTDARRRQAELAINFWNGLGLGLTWISWYDANSLLLEMLDLPPGSYGAPDVVWIHSDPDPSMCFAAIGRKGGAQSLSLGRDCPMGTIVHEMAHTAGLFHEQQRPDRDRYIEVVWENILPDARYNFELSYLVDRDVAQTPYDYGSLMHYPATAFSVNGDPTIVTPNGELIGQRERLSAGDMTGIRAMYPYQPLCTCAAVGSPCECVS